MSEDSFSLLKKLLKETGVIWNVDSKMVQGDPLINLTVTIQMREPMERVQKLHEPEEIEKMPIIMPIIKKRTILLLDNEG